MIFKYNLMENTVKSGVHDLSKQIERCGKSVHWFIGYDKEKYRGIFRIAQ